MQPIRLLPYLILFGVLTACRPALLPASANLPVAATSAPATGAAVAGVLVAATVKFALAGSKAGRHAVSMPNRIK